MNIPRSNPVGGAARFNYDEAFNRNLGLVTEWEQQILRHKRIAIAGMGGVGGAHALTLARLGIGAFHLADLDTFELANFNRQVGAMASTLGQPKVDTLARMTREINPELHIEIFPKGVVEENIDDFLRDVDLFVDGLDFFAIDMRAKVFARCADLGIPALTAGPIGMGAAYLIFLPGKMTFEEYFRLDGLTQEQKFVNFLAGLSPKRLHRTYVVDPSRVKLASRQGPSTAMACQLCAGVAGVEALKILLGRGAVRAAPFFHVFDAYRMRFVRGRLLGGNHNPLQRVKLAIGYRMIRRMMAQSGAGCGGNDADK